MLLLVLALFWVALLAPVAIRHFRDGGAERSIDSFHAEHEVLSRPGYVVAPAHRLDEADEESYFEPPAGRRPHLRVVRSDDTPTTLEARSTWDEWTENYEFDEPSENVGVTTNHYAAAYSSRPREPEVTVMERYEAPLRRRTMRQQRRMVFLSLVGAATLMTVIAVASGASLVLDLAALAWFAVVLYVALGLYSVSQGYLNEPSLNLRLPQRRSVRMDEPVYGDYDFDSRQYLYYDDEPQFEYDEAEAYEGWQREPSRRALG
ncbi:MAG: hypothetical protein WA580_05945 [Acidimicrobiales bacterium]